jgi:hypothetical protein
MALFKRSVTNFTCVRSARVPYEINSLRAAICPLYSALTASGA